MQVRGINHLAMVTGDMNTTVQFYQDVLGFPVVATTGNKPGSYPFRHYFFKVGPQTTLAFFEWPGMVEPFHKPAGKPEQGRWQFDHLSFDVPDEKALLDFQQCLLQAGHQVTPVVDHGFIQSIYFMDPNGIALEASYWMTDATVYEPDQSDIFLFGDPDPVSSLREQNREPVDGKALFGLSPQETTG
jgi:catechol 2,3-dioxygenase-like lactoylglutathione lyase family enzyme